MAGRRLLALGDPLHLQAAIVRNLFGYASAVSLLLFALILAVTILQRLLLRERR